MRATDLSRRDRRPRFSGLRAVALGVSLAFLSLASAPVASAQEDAAKALDAARAGLSEDKVFGGESDPAAVAIVEKYLTAIGGRDMLGKITNRYAKFRNLKYSATGQTEAEIALFMKEGHLYREEWEIKGFQIKDLPLAFVQIYNGKQQEGWVQMLGTVSPLEGRTLSVFVWDKYLDDFFVHWEADGYQLQIDGEGVVDGEFECDILKAIDFTGRSQIRYFFDKESGLLLKKEWFDATGQETVKKEQFYRLYRPLGLGDNPELKIVFPLKIEILVDGDLDTERIYTEVKFNPGLSEKLFDKPEGKAFEGGIKGREDIEDVIKDVGEEGSAPHGVRKPEGSRTTRPATPSSAPTAKPDANAGAEETP